MLVRFSFINPARKFRWSLSLRTVLLSAAGQNDPVAVDDLGVAGLPQSNRLGDAGEAGVCYVYVPTHQPDDLVAAIQYWVDQRHDRPMSLHGGVDVGSHGPAAVQRLAHVGEG